MYQQIPLNLKLRGEATFDNFIAAGNEAILYSLQEPTEQYIYLWGEPACGKSHLLQALCQEYWQQHRSAAYLPLLDPEITDPEILVGMEGFELVCIDDLQAMVGQSAWEKGLFNLFNAIRDEGGRLVISANAPPNKLHIQLADLNSRLNWGVVFQILRLMDDEKVRVLQLRAEQLGLFLSEEVAAFLIKRSPRDMASLFELLNKLDTASLTEQRRLTIPFVKQYL